LVALATPALAVNVRDCNDDQTTASATNIVEPWEKNTKTFYKGQVRAVLIDTGGEPACCSLHLMILSPGLAQDEPPFTACHLISDHDNFGFGNIDFDKIAASYDPKKGLLITVPMIVSNGDDVQKPGVAKVRLNLAAGTVKAEK
jgi:hypothetical protein